MVDAIGQLIQGRLTEGQVHDVTQAPELLRGVPAKCVAADKAYDSQALRDLIVTMGAKVVIPPRPASGQSTRAHSMEQGNLPSSQPRRTLLLPHQALPSNSHSLRKAGRTVYLVYQPRRCHRLHDLNVNTP